MSDLKSNIKSTEDAQTLISKMQEEHDLARIAEMIKDNNIEFEHNDDKYRVRLLTFKEKDELNSLRLKKFGVLIADKDIMMEQDLIQAYKDRGIDIDVINDELKKIDAEIYNQRISLGESLSKNESEVILTNYRDKLITLFSKKQLLDLQKNDLLSMSLENQLQLYIAEVITYLTLDIWKNEQWNRVFKSYDEFLNYDDESLLNKAGIRSMILQSM